MKTTVQITLASGVKLSVGTEVQTFLDLARFGRKVTDFAQQVKRIAPDLAIDKVEGLSIRCGGNHDKPERARERKRRRKHVAAGTDNRTLQPDDPRVES